MGIKKDDLPPLTVCSRLTIIALLDHITLTRPLRIHFAQDKLVVTFGGLFSKTPFLEDMKTILDELQRTFQPPGSHPAGDPHPGRGRGKNPGDHHER